MNNNSTIIISGFREFNSAEETLALREGYFAGLDLLVDGDWTGYLGETRTLVEKGIVVF